MEVTDSTKEDLIEVLFNKQFHYKKSENEDWKLPNFSEIFTTPANKQDFQELNTQKQQLNEVKSSLNYFDIRKWNHHTNFTNPSSKVLSVLHKKIYPELGTQAWCKFYELMCGAEVLPNDVNKTLCTVHLCEAPGGFICGLNHYLKLNAKKYKGTIHKWIANTLNPYYESNELTSCVTDDRLIMYTINSWCFGKDNTGNILKPSFLEDLKAQANDVFGTMPVQLVTADGSLNCQDHPSEQEKIVAPLHYAETFTALSILGDGGNFVLKMFTMFEYHSVCLIYLLCCLFTSVSAVKPATSKGGNSEVYIICRCYSGLESWKEIYKVLDRYFPFSDMSKVAMFPFNSIAPGFLKQHIACTNHFRQYQTEVMLRNVYYYENEDKQASMKEVFTEIHEMVAQRYFDICELKKINTNQCIVRGGNLQHYSKSNIQGIPKLVGSFAERQNRIQQNGSVSLYDKEIQQEIENVVNWIHRPHRKFWWKQTQITTGEAITEIHSSLFCETEVVFDYERLFRQYFTEDIDTSFDKKSSLSIDNIALAEEIGRIITCLNDSALLVSLDDKQNSSGYADWMEQLIHNYNSNLQCCRLNVSDLLTGRKHPPKYEFVFCNMMKPNIKTKWSELGLRPFILDTILVAMRYLRNKGTCVFVLPSALTRLMGQALWLLSNCFEQFCIMPITISFKNALPAIIFVGVKFIYLSNLVHAFSQLCEEIFADDIEILQLFCVTNLLHHDKTTRAFVKSLKQANKCCLNNIIKILNND